MNRLASLFNVEPGEHHLVSLLFVHSFLLGTTNNFVQTAAFALFMVEFDAQALALVYVTNALVIPALTFLYLRLGDRLSFSRLLAVNLGFLLLLILAFRLGLGVGNARAVVFALPALFQILANLGSLEFWTLANRLLNVRQGKRLFGLIGAGHWLAIVLTGLLIPLLVGWLGTANLLFLAAGAMAGALVVLRAIAQAFAAKLVASPAAGPAEAKEPASSLFKNRYVLLIFSLVVLWWFAFYFLDNAFYGAAAAQYPSAEQLASFLGLFLAVLGVMTLLSNTFLTGPVISRYGLRVSLLILPVGLLIGAGAMAVTGLVAGAVSLLFWLLVLNKLLDMALGFSIDRSSLNILYQPLPADQRGQAQTVAEGVFWPLANGVAGLALFGLGALFASNTLPLIYILLLILAAWLVVAFLLGRQYPQMLMGALTQRRLGGTDLSLADGASLDVLQQGLHNPHPGVAIYSLNMLQAIEHESLPAFLQDALQHPAPAVRHTALQYIERLGLTSALPDIGQLIVHEPVPGVRGAAVRTLATLGGSGAWETVSAYLNDPNPPVRQAAMVGLLRSGGIEGVLTAGHQLLHMAGSPESAERVMAAQVLGEVGVGSFYQPLVPLLHDRDVRVQRAALLAAGQLKNARLWPLVIEKLASPPGRRVAAAALVAGGESVLPELTAAFGREAQPPEVQAQLVRVCGRIGGGQATAWLRGHLAHPDAGVRTAVLRGLHRCGYQAPAEETARVQDQIRAEVALSAEALALQVLVGHGDAVALLRAALEGVLARSRARIFLLLSFLYDRQAVLQARDNLTLPSAEKQAYALEVLDVLVSPDLKRQFFPLLADSAPGQKLQQLAATYSPPQWDRSQCLGEIVAAPPGRFSAWTRACALYAAGRLPAPALRDAVAAAQSAADPLVRETATWALRCLDGVERDYQEELMLTTIEKVIALKQASIFAETPDETLAAIAPHLEEVPLRAGETIFDKGDLGDSMYLIVEGQVRVHDGGRTLNHLQAGEVFGEMAVLDAEPRMASVTAVVDTQLLRLAQEPLYEVMDDRSEVGRGVIRVLSQYLRNVTRDLSELHARLEAPEGSP
jgi:ATP/ADP translocase/HEAT repeat protein